MEQVVLISGGKGGKYGRFERDSPRYAIEGRGVEIDATERAWVFQGRVAISRCPIGRLTSHMRPLLITSQRLR